jgi:hypothetical protein
VPAQPVDAIMIQSASRQHTVIADKLAARIANCAGAVRKHLSDGQPAAPAARQIAADVMELIAELAKLSEDSRFTSWTRQSAA